jgi:hypothetical protein
MDLRYQILYAILFIYIIGLCSIEKVSLFIKELFKNDIFRIVFIFMVFIFSIKECYIITIMLFIFYIITYKKIANKKRLDAFTNLQSFVFNIKDTKYNQMKNPKKYKYSKYLN